MSDIVVPKVWRGDLDVAIVGERVPDIKADGQHHVLLGMAVSLGRATARACVCRTLNDAVNIQVRHTKIICYNNTGRRYIDST
jgi:hypothetical protein